jgi:hypothetical protein
VTGYGKTLVGAMKPTGTKEPWEMQQGVFAIPGFHPHQNSEFIKNFYKTTFFTKETIYKFNVLAPVRG